MWYSLTTAMVDQTFLAINHKHSSPAFLAREEVAARGGRVNLVREEVVSRDASIITVVAGLRCLPVQTQYVTLCQYTVVLMNLSIMYVSINQSIDLFIITVL